MKDLEKAYEAIEKAKYEYAKRIIEFVKSQKEKWPLLPDLAREADGRSGYSDQLGMCYRHRVWRIQNSFDGYYLFAIKCSSGKLCSVSYGETLNPIKITEDYSKLAQCEPSYFDVDSIIKYLKEKALKPQSPHVVMRL